MRRLILRPGAIGDCILAFPALEFLKAEYTEVWISSPLGPLVHFADAVRPLSSTGIDLVGIGNEQSDQRFKSKLEGFDSVISWYGSNRSDFREIIEAAGLEYQFHKALPPPDFDGHVCDFFARQVGAPEGLVPRICVQHTQPRNTVIIQPFSGSQRKNWPLAKYRAFARELGTQVEWICGPEEHIENAFLFERLDVLAAWMSGAQLYIGNDSGITHLAAAIGMPVVALFGPTSPRLWGPRGRGVEVLHCDPLDSLEIVTVLEAANRLLGSR